MIRNMRGTIFEALSDALLSRTNSITEMAMFSDNPRTASWYLKKSTANFIKNVKFRSPPTPFRILNVKKNVKRTHILEVQNKSEFFRKVMLEKDQSS